MCKFYWIKVHWHKNFQHIKEHLKKRQYIENSNIGFNISKLRDNIIFGTFIERKPYTLNIKDPFGKLVPFENIKYDYIEFILKNEFVGIEILNPPRSISTFLNELSISSDFKISFESFNVDVNTWINHLQKEKVFTILDVTKIVCDKVPMSRTSTAKIEISGKNDVFSLSHKFKNGLINEVEFTYLHPAFGSGKCVLNKNGYCKIKNSDYVEKIKDIMLVSLKDIDNKYKSLT